MSEVVESIQRRFNIIGQSSQIKEIIALLPQIARTEISVLITGESGTGKEVIAHAIHELSERGNEKLVIVNCGAIPEGILESELFGHEKGAFTGAIESRKGYFELADRGTLFLDEIGDMPMGVQVKILRVLENGTYMRVGGSGVKRTDVRIIAATNKILQNEVQKKNFREDLYYRLRAVQLQMPALQERKEDIPLLFEVFWKEFCRKYNITPEGITENAIKMLMNYSWPGNIRELRNMTESMIVLDSNKLIDERVVRKYLLEISEQTSSRLPMLSGHKPDPTSEIEYLYRMMADIKTEILDIKNMLRAVSSGSGVMPPFVNPTKYPDPMPPSKLLPGISEPDQFAEFEQDDENEDESRHTLSLTDMEKKAISDSLTRHMGNRRKAADELGISERTLYRKIKEYELE